MEVIASLRSEEELSMTGVLNSGQLDGGASNVLVE